MKKIISLLLIISFCLLGLTSCDLGQANSDYNFHDCSNYTSYVYCNVTDPCTNCKAWKDADISNAYSVSCTVIANGHVHYCVTYINK